VIPKGLNEQIGNLTNEQLAKVAQEYQNGKSINGGLQIQSSMDFALLMNEVKDLKSVIKNKPETNIEIGEITGSLMEIVQSTKRGNNTTYNRFKVRK
jgi:ribosomal protein S13